MLAVQIFRRFCIKEIKSTQIKMRFAGTLTLEAAVPTAAAAGKMYAARLTEFSSPISIEEVETPKLPKPSEAIVKVHYCALNGSDVLMSNNSYRIEPRLPVTLGYELVGEIIQLGDEAQAAGYKVGEKVVGLNKDLLGGFAEECLVDVKDIWKKPSTVKSIDAVCLLDDYARALVTLEQQASIEEDDMVFINVGTSSVGFAALDIAANVFRAKVIGVCGSEQAAAAARDRGAFASIKFSDKKFLKQIEKVAAERDIKGIFDGSEGEQFKKLLSRFMAIYNSDSYAKEMLRDDNFGLVVQHLSREGRVIVAGAVSNKEDESKDWVVSGFDMNQCRVKHPEIYRQAGDDVIQFLEEGLVSPSCSMIAGLYKINDAIQFLADSKSSGKVVIDIKNKDAEVEIKG